LKSLKSAQAEQALLRLSGDPQSFAAS